MGSQAKLLRTLMATALAVIGVFAFASVAQADTYTVTKEADTADGTCDSDCSLREAVIAANSTEADDTIVLDPGHYNLTIEGSEEDQAADGDLDLLDNGSITITGTSARNTIIDGLGTADADNLIESERVFDVYARASISNVTIQGGSQFGGGGGIRIRGLMGPIQTPAGFVGSASLSLDHVSVSGNEVSGSGGGIENDGGDLTISRSLLSNNFAESDGGAVVSYDGATTHIENSTIQDNTADSNAGCAGIGAVTGFNADITLLNDTIVDNVNLDGTCSADPTAGLASEDFSSDGVSEEPSGSMTVQNTVVANNQTLGPVEGEGTLSVGGTPELNNCAGPGITSAGYNIEDDTDCSFANTGDLQNTDPKLGGLDNNGGQTDTRALLDGSPAINTAGPGAPATDQRDVSRPQGAASDIGAFEVEVPAPPTTQPVQPVQQQQKPGAPKLAVAGVRRACTSSARVSVKVKATVASGTTLKQVRVTLDGKRLYTSKKGTFTLKVNATRLKAGRHRLRVTVLDSAGGSKTTTKVLARCAQAKPKAKVQPRFTG
ncbi:MAG TPA: CSLREA domain-containing protein [Thermoleophilaceae bacterium]